jgi:hypothetical protein
MTAKLPTTVKWYEVNNWIPIIASVMTITLSYGVLMTRISILETKIDTLLNDQKIILTKYSDVESRYGMLSLKVRNLETIAGIK